MKTPKVRGKYEKSGKVSYLGTEFTWYARYIKDEESQTPRFVLDERSVNYEVTKVDVLRNIGEIQAICLAKAKEAESEPDN